MGQLPQRNQYTITVTITPRRQDIIPIANKYISTYNQTFHQMRLMVMISCSSNSSKISAICSIYVHILVYSQTLGSENHGKNGSNIVNNGNDSLGNWFLMHIQLTQGKRQSGNNNEIIEKCNPNMEIIAKQEENPTGNVQKYIIIHNTANMRK